MNPGTASSGLCALILSALFVRGADPPRRGGEGRDGNQLADDDNGTEPSASWLFARERRGGEGAVGDEALEDERGPKLTLRRPPGPGLRCGLSRSDDGDEGRADEEDDRAMTLLGLLGLRDGEGLFRDELSEEKRDFRRPLLGPPYSRVGDGQSEDDEEGVKCVKEVTGLLPGLLAPGSGSGSSDPEDSGSTTLRLLPGRGREGGHSDELVDNDVGGTKLRSCLGGP